MEADPYPTQAALTFVQQFAAWFVCMANQLVGSLCGG